jgi:osmotically-inducible protein OsmY
MPTQRTAVATFLAGVGVGAVAAYIFDPRAGKRRRHMAIEQASARARSGAHDAQGAGHRVVDKAKGLVAEATPSGRDAAELNDPGLAAKVESELFKPADAPKGAVDVNVEDGVVFLRGELESRERIEELRDRAAHIDGVREVASRLHVAGEPTPGRPL